MTIQIDSREKKRAIKSIIETFNDNGIKHFTSKLHVGDYMNIDNPRVIVDRKQNLLEICSNVCQQHNRFISEIERAKDIGIKLIFLCEHGKTIKTIDDVFYWKNPRLSLHPLAMSGERLYRVLSSIHKKYGVDFMFCSKKETGHKIIEILS